MQTKENVVVSQKTHVVVRVPAYSLERAPTHHSDIMSVPVSSQIGDRPPSRAQVDPDVDTFPKVSSCMFLLPKSCTPFFFMSNIQIKQLVQCRALLQWP